MSTKTFFGKLLRPQAAAQREQELAERRATEAAAGAEAKQREEQLRIEEKFGITPIEKEREERAAQLEKERETELRRREELPGEELLAETGPTTRRLLEQIASRQGKTGEELFREEGGDVAGLLIDELSQPGALQTFGPELELALQEVNKQAAKRGVFGGLPEGGIRFEQLGRAGVDLAIKGARERLAQQSALASQLFAIGGQAREEAGVAAERGLTEQAGARVELGAFLGDIQNLTAQAKGRATQAGLGAFGIAQPGITSFQAVPTQIATFGVGQAAKKAAETKPGLAEIGGPLLSAEGLFGSKAGGAGQQQQQQQALGTPGGGLGQLTGGKGFISPDQLDPATLAKFATFAL